MRGFTCGCETFACDETVETFATAEEAAAAFSAAGITPGEMPGVALTSLMADMTIGAGIGATVSFGFRVLLGNLPDEITF
jgi:hypothetical protein